MAKEHPSVWNYLSLYFLLLIVVAFFAAHAVRPLGLEGQSTAEKDDC